MGNTHHSWMTWSSVAHCRKPSCGTRGWETLRRRLCKRVVHWLSLLKGLPASALLWAFCLTLLLC